MIEMWVDTYKPRKLSDVVNQKKALDIITKWFVNWNHGCKPLLLHGPPGTGKTCSIEALASEKNYDFIEMNASDVRSATQIKEVIGKSMAQQSLFKKGKIFLLDEIEALYGKEDFGGVKEIINMIKESQHRVILTSNNPYDPKLRTLRTYCILVHFTKIPVWDMERRLRHICEKEGIKTGKEVLRRLASLSEGDLRSATNDLEIVSRGRKKIVEKDLEVLGYRERETNIFDVLKIIFKTKTALAAKLAINNADKDPDEIFWWIENNIAKEYEEPEEVAKAYDALSMADLFRQRVLARQNWRMKGYMIDMMTAGVATAKKEMYRKFTRYEYPNNIMILGRTKMGRKTEKEALLKLSTELHCSTKKIRKEFLPFMKIMVKDKQFITSLKELLGQDMKVLLSKD